MSETDGINRYQPLRDLLEAANVGARMFGEVPHNGSGSTGYRM